METDPRFRVLIERGWEAVTLVDREGSILYASASSTRVWGYSQEESVNRSVFEFVHPDDLSRVVAQFQILVGEAGGTAQAEYRVQHRNGTWRWTESTATNLLDEPSVRAVVIYSHDVTARKHAEEALRTVTAQAPCLLFYAEVEDRGTELGWSVQVADQAAAQEFLQLVTPPDRDTVHAWWESRNGNDQQVRQVAAEAVRSGKSSYRQEYRLRNRLGEERWYSEALHLIPLAPKRWRAVGVCTDITEHKQLEDDLRRQTDDLAAADRRKDEFLAMLAHELRNPLSAIGGAVYLLERIPGADAEARRLQSLVARQTRHLTRLLDDLLDVSRIAHSKLTLRWETLDFREVTQRALENSGVLAHRSGHRLSSSTPPEPLWVRGDAARLEQVVTNLLSNAVKYTPPGGEIGIWAGHLEDAVVLQVTDSGIGIPPELLPTVFDLFMQAEQAPDRAQGGLGIGLSLVRSLVEMHGGTVTAESGGPWQGSTFCVHLPIADPPVGAASRSLSPVAAKPTRILVVEDSQDAAETLQDVLEFAGHEVRVAHTGIDGLQQADVWQPGVVLCDIGLPGLNGYEVAEQLRANSRTTDVYLIALTGFGQEADRQRALAAGFDLHLTKPVDLEHLQRVIAEGREAARNV